MHEKELPGTATRERVSELFGFVQEVVDDGAAAQNSSVRVAQLVGVEPEVKG